MRLSELELGPGVGSVLESSPCPCSVFTASAENLDAEVALDDEAETGGEIMMTLWSGVKSLSMSIKIILPLSTSPRHSTLELVLGFPCLISAMTAGSSRTISSTGDGV